MTAERAQTVERGAVAVALAAFVFWGLVPIYYKALEQVASWEVLAHRVIWSVPLLVLFLAVRDGKRFWKNLAVPPSTIAWLVLSGLLVSFNWLVFVWAVANGHTLDTSLGYFGTPLVNVILGFLFLKERLSAVQVIAVLIAGAGTVYLGWYLGGAPWIALSLACSFGLYGLLRKRIPVGPMLGLLWETSLMLVPALIYLAWLHGQSAQSFLQVSTDIDLLLVGSGLTTVLPLIWFNMAAKRMPLSVLGFLQYTAPCISFMVAVFLFGEPFTHGHVVAFTCIWSALALVSIEPIRRVAAGRARV